MAQLTEQVPGETHELFSAMGFEVQQTFDEVVNSPEHVSRVLSMPRPFRAY